MKLLSSASHLNESVEMHLLLYFNTMPPKLRGTSISYNLPASFTASDSALVDFDGGVSSSSSTFVEELLFRRLSIENGLASIDTFPLQIFRLRLSRNEQFSSLTCCVNVQCSSTVVALALFVMACDDQL